MNSKFTSIILLYDTNRKKCQNTDGGGAKRRKPLVNIIKKTEPLLELLEPAYVCNYWGVCRKLLFNFLRTFDVYSLLFFFSVFPFFLF